MHEQTMAIIALGSNLGDAGGNVLRAMERLEQLSSTPLRKSSLWQTDPIDCPPGSSPFVNAIVVLTPRNNETPELLLKKLLRLEREFGRKPKKLHNEARPLDLDLIAFGDETRNTTELTLPHPRAHTRRFVLEPLNEVCPGFVLPGQTKSAKQLLEELPAWGEAKRIS